MELEEDLPGVMKIHERSPIVCPAQISDVQTAAWRRRANEGTTPTALAITPCAMLFLFGGVDEDPS